MASRLLAGALLVVCALVAWLTLIAPAAARILQGLILLSLAYVGALAWQGWRVMREAEAPTAEEEPMLPFLSLVVPARNEAPVIGALVADLVALDYAVDGKPNYEVLVVDDGSTDGTADRARAAAAGSAVVEVAERAERDPATKGAVLAWARPRLRGEVMGVIDADSRVPPSLLRAVIHAWGRDPGAVAIQAQRRSGNASAAWLAAAQDEELLMDMASQCGRWSTDGTAELRGTGMFVRTGVLDALGGWAAHALTEDLELSTRLVLAGERVCLAPEAVLHEEAVTDWSTLWRQRMRWAEGSVRRLMELGPRLVMAGSLPLGRRVDFVIFTTEFLVPPLFVTTTIASIATIPLPAPSDWTIPASLFAGYGLGTYLLALAGLAAHGVRGAALVGRAARGALFLSHWLLVVPGALLRIAMGPRTTRFVQTPHAGAGRG